MNKPELICTGCGKKPAELSEYTEPAKSIGMTAEQYAWEEEGTLNKENGHFLCTECYIKRGMPLGIGGSRWTCP